MKRRVPSVPLQFVVVGLANTMIGLAIVYLLKWLVGVVDTAANVGAYSLGHAASVLFNRNWTFYHSGAWLPALARFLLVFAVPTPLTSARSLCSSSVPGETQCRLRAG